MEVWLLPDSSIEVWYGIGHETQDPYVDIEEDRVKIRSRIVFVNR